MSTDTMPIAVANEPTVEMEIVSPPELVREFRWSPTQSVVLALGVAWAALGGIGLARAGSQGIVDAFTPQVAVGLWSRSPLMASIELAIGLLLLLVGAQRLTPKAAYRFIGGFAAAFGIVLASVPQAFETALGTGRNSGWLYIVFGAVMLILGFMSPIVFEREIVTERPAHKAN